MIIFKASAKSRGFFVCLGVVLGLGKFAALNGVLVD